MLSSSENTCNKGLPSNWELYPMCRGGGGGSAKTYLSELHKQDFCRMTPNVCFFKYANIYPSYLNP